VHGPELLGGFEDCKPLRDWASPIATLIGRVYGSRELDRNVPDQRLIVQACEQLRNVLLAITDLPGDLLPTCTGAHAIRLVLELARDASIPPEADDSAVELVGPLELPMDDADAIIITGLNEGRWSESVNAHAFLPNTLRKHLGLMDNTRRHARDAYALRTIVASRRPVALMAGRRDGEGNPILPSRLLLADEPQRIAERLIGFYGESADPVRTKPPITAGSSTRFLTPPLPTPLHEFKYLRVTDFKTYLQCPYRFYLSRALELAVEDDRAMEMDPMAFGGLAHTVLELMAQRPIKDSTSAGEIREFLVEELRALARDRFGDEPLPALAVQLRQLETRLSAFAAVQARRAQAGWVIQAGEKKFEGPGAFIEVDGKPMALHGKIDRIDYHEKLKRWAVLDYKTSSSAKSPDAAHRKGRGANKTWTDLQLPMYRHLVRGHVDEAAMATLQLGYITLPARVEDVDVLIAEWSADELATADAEAQRIIRAIRSGEFPMNASAGPYDVFSAICGVGLRFAAASAAGEVDA
jgi:hypothetical protein